MFVEAGKYNHAEMLPIFYNSQNYLTLVFSQKNVVSWWYTLKNGMEETSTTHKVVKIPDTPGCGDIDWTQKWGWAVI